MKGTHAFISATLYYVAVYGALGLLSVFGVNNVNRCLSTKNTFIVPYKTFFSERTFTVNLKKQKANLVIGMVLFLSLFLLNASPTFAASSSKQTASYNQQVKLHLQQGTKKAPAVLYNKLMNAVPHGDCGIAMVTIWYNYGNNVFCVSRHGYNGLDYGLSNVTWIGLTGGNCDYTGIGAHSWLRAYNGNGFYSYFNSVGWEYGSIQPPYNYMTQIDVTDAPNCP